MHFEEERTQRITPYSASGHSALGPAEVRSGIEEAFQRQGRLFSRTHPHILTASRLSEISARTKGITVMIIFITTKDTLKDLNVKPETIEQSLTVTGIRTGQVNKLREIFKENLKAYFALKKSLIL